MSTDEELLEIYMLGFNDELNGEIQKDKLTQIAYNLGRIDAIVGDDISSSDLQSDDTILSKIKCNL